MPQLKITETSANGEVIVDGVVDRTCYYNMGENPIVDLLLEPRKRDKDCTLPKDAVYRVMGNGVIQYVYRHQSAYLINDSGKTIQVIWNACKD